MIGNQFLSYFANTHHRLHIFLKDIFKLHQAHSLDPCVISLLYTHDKIQLIPLLRNIFCSCDNISTSDSKQGHNYLSTVVIDKSHSVISRSDCFMLA